VRPFLLAWSKFSRDAELGIEYYGCRDQKKYHKQLQRHPFPHEFFGVLLIVRASASHGLEAKTEHDYRGDEGANDEYVQD
jgi:hypothetical protein